MPSPLHSTVNELAARFANDLLRALRGASLTDLQSMAGATASRPPSTPRSGKRRRQTSAEVQKMADKIVALVMQNAKGIRSEELRRALGVATGNEGAKVFNQPMALALKSNKVRKEGQRRATVYFAK